MSLMRALIALTTVLTAVVLGGAALLAPSAGAATFCVNLGPGGECSGTPSSSIHAALGSASGTSGRDTIEIAGGHTYEEGGLVDPLGLAVDIVGVGATPPTLAATPGATVLEVENETATVSNLAISIKGSGSTGMIFDGAVAQGVTIAGQAAGNESIGIELRHGVLRESSVQLAHSLSVGTDAVTAAGSTRIETSTLEATDGLVFECCATDVLASRIETIGPVGVRAGNGGHQRIEDSLLLVSGLTKGNGTSGAILASGAPGNPETITADGVTALDLDHRFSFGVNAEATSPNTTVSVRNSILRGFTTDLRASGAGTAIAADYDDYATAEPTAAGAIQVGDHVLDVDPGFLDPGAGNYRLASSSPLIDRGDPSGPPSGASGLDFYGSPRLASGPGGQPLLDIGAAEYQPAAASPSPPDVASGPPAPRSPTPSRRVGPALRLSKAPRRLNPRGALPYSVGCPAGLDAPCAGTIVFDAVAESRPQGTASAARGQARRVASAKFTVASGATLNSTAPLARSGRRLLATPHAMKLVEMATARSGDSLPRVSTAKFELLPPR